MQARITVITLTVTDLDRAVGFYRDGLGWDTEGIIGTEFEDGAVAFFDLAGGLTLALWPRMSLAHDARLGAPAVGTSPVGSMPGAGPSADLSLGHNVRSRGEVDSTFQHAVAAGATPVRPPQPTSWGGYSAYIADPDGHLWEIVYNPDLIPQ
jgi:catechol 2,3-dioxygenase-like lactoylglutathione lyase family enzyme